MYTCVFQQGPEKTHLSTGACPGFLKGGGPISLGSLKKRSSDFKRGGVQWSEGGGSSKFVSL